MKEVLKFTIEMNKLEKQLEKEIRIQMGCSHPHIISLYCKWEHDKKIYIAMEYGQRNLLQLIEAGESLPE